MDPGKWLGGLEKILELSRDGKVFIGKARGVAEKGRKVEAVSWSQNRNSRGCADSHFQAGSKSF